MGIKAFTFGYPATVLRKLCVCVSANPVWGLWFLSGTRVMIILDKRLQALLTVTDSNYNNLEYMPENRAAGVRRTSIQIVYA